MFQRISATTQQKGPLLYQAIENGDIKAVNELLSSFTAPNYISIRNPYKKSKLPLVLAASHPKPEILIKLLEHYKNKIGTHEKNKAFENAAKDGNSDVISILLDRCGNEINPNTKEWVLTIAVQNGHEAIVATLLDRCEADICSNSKRWALQDATENGHAAIVATLLVKCGNDIHAKCKGWALAYAARDGNAAIVTILLDRCGPDIYGIDKDWALQYAAEKGRTAIVSLLLNRCGCDIDGNSKRWALTKAVENGHEAIVSNLLMRCAGDIDESDKGSALQSAARNGHPAVVTTLLVSCGNDIGADHKGLALRAGAQNCQELIVVTLLDQCSNDISVDDKSLAFQSAAKNGHTAIVTTLLARCGSDISVDDKSLAFQSAAKNGHAPVVTRLIERCGSDIGANSKGWALQNAAQNGHAAVVASLLERCGSDIGANSKGWALEKATAHGHTTIITTLLDRCGDEIGATIKGWALANATPYFDPQSCESLYENLNEIVDNSFILAKCFIKLMQINLDYRNHQSHYGGLTWRGEDDIVELAEILIKLAQSNFSWDVHLPSFKDLINNLDDMDRLFNTLVLLNKIGFGYSEETKQYYSSNFSITHADLSCYVLQLLIKSQYTAEDHRSLLNIILSTLTSKHVNRTMTIKMLKASVDYSRLNTLLTPSDEGYSDQIKDLELLINQQNILTEGPLGKSAATIELERILNLISTIDISEVRIKYNNIGHYILITPSEKVNLSILLNNSNLTQFSLSTTISESGNIRHSNDTIERLGKILEKLYPKWNAIDSCNPVVNLLPLAQQKAIEIYTSELYKNINKFFRGEALDPSTDRLFSENNPETEHLICFILGCLLNDAVNAVPSLVANHQENNPSSKLLEGYLAPENALLDRGEFLTPDIIKMRLANPWILPATTSFSAHIQGSSYFHKSGTTRTKLENPRNLRPIINKSEDEIIFAQGEQVITSQGPGYLITRLVNSPSLQQPDQRWSDSALASAFKYHLLKEYTEETSEITINGTKVFRPNHNAPHVLRVMKGIDLVLAYFIRHAKDPQFKIFCNSISKDEVEWLRVAAAFSITGRNSEISAGENLERYDQYRSASAEHFRLFVEKTKDLSIPKNRAMAERMYNIIRYMGNPHYEQGQNNQLAINCISDDVERNIRNYNHRILSIAHKLDLPRCYSPTQFMESMQCCLNLSEFSTAQSEDFNQMVGYIIELIKEHGGHLSCDLGLDGQLGSVHRGYQDVFSKASTSLTTLYALSKSVTLPRLLTTVFDEPKESMQQLSIAPIVNHDEAACAGEKRKIGDQNRHCSDEEPAYKKPKLSAP
ncbi:MAG: SidE phosphodiesterase domain-containing protein [Gammaproteobacteria bacterium]